MALKRKRNKGNAVQTRCNIRQKMKIFNKVSPYILSHFRSLVTSLLFGIISLIW